MPTNDIADTCKAIREHWEEIKRDFFELVPGHYLEIDCAYRSPEEQFELFKKGRTMGMDGTWHIENKEQVVTNVDGHHDLGAHNFFPARAIDVCVVDNQTGKRLWNPDWYNPLIEIAARYNLGEGGTWRSLKDWPHLEVKDFKNYREV